MSQEFIRQTYDEPPDDGFSKEEMDTLAESIFTTKGFKVSKSTKSSSNDNEDTTKVAKAKARTKKTDKVKDPNKPKRAKSAYIIWSSSPEGVNKIKEDNTELTHKEALSEAGKVWKLMKENKETSKYDNLALKDKERYEQEMAEYNA
tara:strand:+ start:64 stop:504 length:441 start_codon:yes stop_codon:yes gene_type:complete